MPPLFNILGCVTIPLFDGYEMPNLNVLWKEKILQKPKIVDWRTFNNIDGEILYRGIPSYASVESEFEGTHLPNYQLYGPGLYFAFSKYEASLYTQKNGTLLLAKLANNANLVIDRTVNWLEEEWYGFEQLECFVGKSDGERIGIAREYLEKSVDAYVTAEGFHIAILDRSKLFLAERKTGDSNGE